VPCAPEMLMCPRHWNMVPFDLQQEVWRTYRHGQCDDMNPSREWHESADKAIAHVHRIESGMMRPVDGRLPLWAITIRQPWAHLIVSGHKTIENREWAPPKSLLKQWIAIHAAKTFDRDHWEAATKMAEAAGVEDPYIKKSRRWLDAASHMVSRAGSKAIKDVLATCVPYGSIVALAQIENVIDESHLTERTRPWFLGPFAWVLTNVMPLSPVACSGKQGFWRVEDGTVLQAVRESFRKARETAPPSH
jgi:hypothetical protein